MLDVKLWISYQQSLDQKKKYKTDRKGLDGG